MMSGIPSQQLLLALLRKFLALLPRETPGLAPRLGTGFTNGKRVVVVFMVEVGQGVINESVGRFVGSDSSDDI